MIQIVCWPSGAGEAPPLHTPPNTGQRKDKGTHTDIAKIDWHACQHSDRPAHRQTSTDRPGQTGQHTDRPTHTHTHTPSQRQTNRQTEQKIDQYTASVIGQTDCNRPVLQDVCLLLNSLGVYLARATVHPTTPQPPPRHSPIPSPPHPTRPLPTPRSQHCTSFDSVAPN